MTTRSEAKEAGSKRYHGCPCIRCNKTEKYTSNGGCIICKAARRIKYHSENKAKEKIRRRKYYQANKRTEIANRSAYGRRRIERQATPPWASKKIMIKLYREGHLSGMHVDHIIPLTNNMVCGLHWEENMQLLTPEANIAKGNKFIED